MTTSTTLGPVTLPDGVLTMRTPRLRDAEAWSAARLANRKWLERAFPAWGPEWEAEQSLTAWAQRVRALRRARRHGARPFVVFLDDRLIGEVGVDAVDVRSGTGEASAWLIRDHGGPDVMIAASALLVAHCFDGDTPLDRVLSPVATTSRRGRTPGLSAVGFGIEATVPRSTGHGDAVDHDMWIVHNTPDVRAGLAALLADLDRSAGRSNVRPDPVDATPLRALAPAVARALVRDARAHRHTAAESRRVDVTGGAIDIATDVGTATTTFVLRLDDPAAAAALLATVGRLADNAATDSPQVRRLEVRLAATADELASGLTRFGFIHVATYRANPDGPNAYAGEQVWSRTTR